MGKDAGLPPGSEELQRLADERQRSENVATGPSLPNEESQQVIRDGEELFRTFANTIPQLCWMANADGWLFWYNQRWYEYTGTTPEQMEGWGWQSVHDPEVLPQVLEQWKASIATGKPFEMEFPLRGADDVFRPFLTRGVPVYDQEGTVVQWCGTNTDVTERKRGEEALRRQEERLRLALEAARMATWDWHVPSGQIIWNEMHYRMMGYEPGELTPTYEAWASRVHPEDIDAAQSMIQQCMAERRVYTSEFRTLWPDGTIRFLEARGDFEYDKDNQPLRCYGVMIDVTERKPSSEKDALNVSPGYAEKGRTLE